MSTLTFDDDVLCIRHHPTQPQFSVSSVTGHLTSFSYDPEDPTSRTELWSTKRHKKACRSIAYSLDGTTLVSVGADQVIKRAHSDSGKVIQKWTNAHEETINAVSWVNEHVFCTGDDNGIVKAWDIRKTTDSGCLRTFTTHEDYISSFLALDEKFILSTSGDGSLAVHDLRATKESKALIKRSDDQEDDLTCCVLLKASSKRPKLCVGTSSGVISIFNRGDWGDCNDRILPPRAPDTSKRGKKGQAKKNAASDDEIGVECMAKVDENTLVVGGADGKVRLLQVLPNRWVRVVGDFESGEPVEDVMVKDDWVFAVSGSEMRMWTVEEPDAVDVPEPKEEESDTAETEDENVADSGSKEESDEEDDEEEEEKNNQKDNDDESDGDQFSSDSDDEPKRKKPKKTRPVIQEKKNTFFDDL